MKGAKQTWLRVIAGQAKGCKLLVPPGLTTRPTPARVREALWMGLMSRGPLGCGLDAFAGSGANGIEALSRGAPSVLFAEPDRAARAALTGNLARLPPALAARAHVFAGCALAALASLARSDGGTQQGPLAWIYADPPFAGGHYEPLLAACADHPAVDDATVLVLEHEASLPLPQHSRWLCTRSANYGRVALSFYHRSPPEKPGRS